MNRVVMALALLLAVMVAPAQSETSEGSEEISIGMVLPLTGTLAGIAASMQNGAELALQAVNAERSVPLQFVFEDSAGDPEQAVAAFEQLIEEGEVVAILGPVTSTATEQAFPVAQANSVVALAPTAAAAGLSEIGEFAFVGTLTQAVLVPSGVALTQERLGYERVAIMTDADDVFSQSSLEFLQAALAERGVEIVATESFASGEEDFSEGLSRIAGLEPDALFIATLPGEAAAILIQARDIGMPSDMTMIPVSFSATEIETAGEAAEGAITFSTWDSAADTPGNQAFVEAYRDTYDSEPSRFVAQWHAAVTVLAAAIDQAESLDPVAIRDALAEIEVDTVLGTYTFDESGGAVFDPIIQVVRDGMLVPF